MEKRHYDNASRRQKSLQNQKLIIETLVQLLVEKKGGEVTFEAIAKKAKISERTIYRFFKDKAALHQEMDRHLANFLAEGYDRLSELDIPDFGQFAFSLFDKHEPLVIAYLFSPFGYDARRIFRKRLNQAVIGKVVDHNPKAADEDKRLAFVASLVSAKLWHDIRADFGYSGVEMGPTVKWAISTLLNNIETR